VPPLVILLAEWNGSTIFFITIFPDYVVETIDKIAVNNLEVLEHVPNIAGGHLSSIFMDYIHVLTRLLGEHQ
jgi:hypothetical protein